MNNSNMDNVAQDHQKWWQAKETEHKARLEKMDAEQRMAANDAFEDFRTEFDATTDWTEATWNQFKSKLNMWWNSK